MVFCHNDLAAEHILIDPVTSTVTGLIDWTDAAITDPAVDFALLYRDLGPTALTSALSHYHGQFSETDQDRAIFYARCALLEDIHYGARMQAKEAKRYLDAGLAHLEHTFS